MDVASEEIEADLSRWYPTFDLADLSRWPSRLTHRKLNVFLNKLPEDSAWKTWVRDNITVKLDKDPKKLEEEAYTGQPWSLLNRQVQGLRNDIHLATHQLAQVIAASLGGQQGSIPEFESPYSTPHIKIEAEKEEAQNSGVISLEERRAMLEKVRRNRGWSSLMK